MSTATVTSKGQVTIPIDIRVGLGIKAGDRVDFVMDEDLGQVVFLPATKSLVSLKGIIAKPDTPVSIEDMKATIKSKGGQG